MHTFFPDKHSVCHAHALLFFGKVHLMAKTGNIQAILHNTSHHNNSHMIWGELFRTCFNVK